MYFIKSFRKHFILATSLSSVLGRASALPFRPSWSLSYCGTFSQSHDLVGLSLLSCKMGTRVRRPPGGDDLSRWSSRKCKASGQLSGVKSNDVIVSSAPSGHRLQIPWQLSSCPPTPPCSGPALCTQGSSDCSPPPASPRATQAVRRQPPPAPSLGSRGSSWKRLGGGWDHCVLNA